MVPDKVLQPSFVKHLLYAKNTGMVSFGETVPGVPLFSLLGYGSGGVQSTSSPHSAQTDPVLDRNTGMEQKGQYKTLPWFSEFRHLFFKFTRLFPRGRDKFDI